MSGLDKHFNKGYLVAVVAAVIYIAFILFSDWQTLIKSFEKIKPEFLVLLVVVEFAVLVLRTMRNRIFLKSLDIHISYRRNILIYFAGLAMTITPGNAGEMVRAQFLKREVGKPIASTIPIYFGERLNDLIVVTIITSIFLVFVDFAAGKIVMMVSVGIIVVLFALLKSVRLFKFFRKKTGSIKFLQKFSDGFDQIHDSLQNILGKNIIKKTLPASVPIWMMHGFTAYVALLAFGVDIGFMETYVIYLSSLIIGVLSFIPAGIGVTETSLVGLFGAHGVNFSLAVAITLILRFMTIWFAAIVGIFASKILLSRQPPTNLSN